MTLLASLVLWAVILAVVGHKLQVKRLAKKFPLFHAAHVAKPEPFVAGTYKRPTFTRWLLFGPFSLLVPKKVRIK